MNIYTDSLFEGSYVYSAYVRSNDPVDSVLEIKINLTLDGISETYISRNTCFDLDTLVKGGVYLDSVFVENLGCDSLYFNSLSSTDAIFSASAAYSQIGVGDSGWVIVTISPTTVGNISDTVFVNTSDTTWPLCYSGYVAEAPNAWVNTSPINISTVNCGDSAVFSLPVANTTASTNLNWSITSGEVLNVLLVNYNVYPSLLSNLNSYLGTVGDMNIKSVTTLNAAVSELNWADVVIFPSITAAPSTTDYTNIEDDMETFINDGGKMIIIGSAFVSDILAMDFISGYYYGNYTNYTHYVNTTLNHPYTQGLPSSFTAQSAAMNARITNTGTQQLAYYSYYSHGLTVSPIGDGELIYFAYNWNQTYSEIETMMGNILTSSLDDKKTGLNWISFPTSSGTTSGGDTTTVYGTAYSDSLDAGVHNLNITVTTNDPTGGTFSIPVVFTVNGQGESTLDAGCEAWGSSFQNMTHVRDVAVYNVGCDTLTISSVATAGSDFSASASNVEIAPGDTGYVPVSLYSSTLGATSDTLSIYTDADTVYKCLTATIVGASDIAVAPNPINVTVNKCNSFTTVPYTITNNGSASLSYDVSVAEVYDSSYTQTWLYPAPNYSNQLTFSFNNIIDSDTLFYEIILNGAYSNTNQYYYLYLNNSYIQTLYDNNVADYTNDTITGFITGWQLSNAITAGYFDIRLYSYNYTSVTGQTATVRVKQRNSVSWAAPVGLTSGSVTAGNSVSKSLLVTVTSLALGTYNTSVIFETNDPSDPFYSVPMTVNVVSEPDMELSSSALNYGTVYDTQPNVSNITVENNGCTDLSITNITSNNSHFVPGWTSQTIAAGGSAILPVTFTATTPGTELGILTFANNDSIQIVNLQANVVFAPVADYQYTVQNNCTGLVSFSNESTNGSQYFWAFDDGSFSAAVNPSHTYTKPGTYNVMLVTSNTGGADTTYKTVTLNDVLYVDFAFPVSVQAGQVIQFIDSSMYPVSWQWFFGDGNNSTTPNPQHTYANKGTYIVTLLASNGAGCSGSSNKQIDVLSGIGLDESTPDDLSIYPVPTTGNLTVETAAEVESITLYNMTGQFITEVRGQRSLDLSTLPAGTYMLRISGETWVVNRSVELLK
jgi:PKD repeat protein